MTTPKRPLYLYLAINTKPGDSHNHFSTLVGCTSDVEVRMAIHNSPVVTPICDKRAKKIAGWWQVVLIVCVPRATQLSCSAILSQWRKAHARAHTRLQFGIDVARHFRLPYFVDSGRIFADPRFTANLPKAFLAEHCTPSTAMPNLEELGAAVVSPHSALANHSMDGINYKRKPGPPPPTRSSEKRKYDGEKVTTTLSRIFM